MCVPDVKWGKYLITFEHDHLEVAGLNPRVFPRHVASLMIDNLRVHDVRRFEEAEGFKNIKKYGRFAQDESSSSSDSEGSSSSGSSRAGSNDDDEAAMSGEDGAHCV